MYKESIVIYVDILGFSNIVLRNSFEQVNLLYDDFRRVFDIVNSRMGTFPSKRPPEKTETGYKIFMTGLKAKNIEMTFFSDSVVWCYPIEGSRMAFDDIVEFICRGLFDLFALVFSKGIAIRGGVSIGNMYKANDKIFGDGLVAAYRLEGRAVFPRIVFDRRVIDRLKPGAIDTTFDNALLYDKNCDFYSFNYFDIVNAAVHPEVILPQRMETVTKYIDPVIEIVEHGLQNPDEHIRLKYQWLKDEFEKYTSPKEVQDAIRKWSQYSTS